MSRLIDLSHPLDAETPPWPGNPSVSVDVLDAIPIARGAGEMPASTDEERHVNVTAFRTCNHTGTHMDAPSHFYNGVPTIDHVPLDHCVGPAVLIDVSHLPPRGEITLDCLEKQEALLRVAHKVVFRTGWSRRWGLPDFFTDYPVIAEDAARWLVSREVHLIGVDTPSVDREPHASHYVILGAHTVIVENLTNLELVSEGVFELIVLPLPLRGLDGSPVRAVARLQD